MLIKKLLKVFKILLRHIRFAKYLGLSEYVRYYTARDKDIVLVKMKRSKVYLRKGTPDLSVAFNCLVRGEFDVITKHLDKSFSGVIVDAGGYIGTSALALSDLFPNAQILVIEPSLENLKILKMNVSKNEKIRVIYGALVGSDLDSIMLKNRSSGEWGFTTVDKPIDNLSIKELHETPAFKLSNLGVDIADIGLLKLNIEGGEYDLLVNDQETLSRIRVVVAKLHDRIVMGCSEAFKNFSENRLVFKYNNKNYFSIRK
jgi:FkbM family methyltransferase